MPSFVWLRLVGWGVLALGLVVVGLVLWRRGGRLRWFRGCLVRLVALALLAGGGRVASRNIPSLLRSRAAERALRESVRDLGASPRVVESYVASNLPLVTSPPFAAFRERHAPRDGSAPESEPATLAALSELGVARFDAASLRHAAELHHQLARASPAACQGLWTHQLEPAQRLVALDGLSDPELEAWFALSARAAKLELAHTVAAQSIPYERLESAVEALCDRLSPSQAGWLRQAWNSGVDADPRHGCLAYLMIADNRERVRGEDYAVLTRYLAAPSTIVRARRAPP